jgi:hypothetical protein
MPYWGVKRDDDEDYYCWHAEPYGNGPCCTGCGGRIHNKQKTTMKTITVWAAYITVDEYGRHGDLKGIYTTEDDAEKAADGIGWYGGRGSVNERKAVEAGNSKYFLLDDEVDYLIPINKKISDEADKARRAALRKLTVKEREMLGLEDKEEDDE